MFETLKRILLPKRAVLSLRVTRTPEAIERAWHGEAKAALARVNARIRRELGFDRSTKRRPRNAPRSSAW
jgi:hypothetical protein